jgi:hypothetical protein
MRRLLSLATVAVALSSSFVATFGSADPAFAQAGPTLTAGSSVVCTSLKYVKATGAANLGKCYTASGATAEPFKTLVAASSSTLLNGGSLNWTPGPAGGATVTTGTLTAVAAIGTCPKKDHDLAYSGSITGVSGKGNPVANDDVVYVNVCVGRTVSLAKGSYAEF